MDSIRIQNFRSFKDTGKVEFSPLTFLVGTNSSGKSSFLRILPLLKQSVNVPKRGPLLWYGEETDFGDFKTAVHRGQDCISLSLFYREIKSNSWKEDKLEDVTLSLTIRNSSSMGAFVSSYSMKFNKSQSVDVQLGTTKNQTKVFVNSTDYSELFDCKIALEQDGIIPPICFASSAISSSGSIGPFLKKMFMGKDMTERQEFLLYRILDSSIGDAVINHIEKILPEYHDLLLDSKNRKTLIDYAIISSLSEIIKSVENHIRRDMASLTYVKPLRATSERYYRTQNMSVRNLDSDGHNMAMYLVNLYKNKDYKKAFQKWTMENFRFTVDAVEMGGHVSVTIKREGHKESDNIADMGFGYSQILPIVIVIWQNAFKGLNAIRMQAELPRTILIEQPELHLHPAMQADFADMLVKSVQYARSMNLSIRFVVETHSQTIINRIGLNIALEKASPDIAQVLLFNYSEEEGTRIVKSSYSSEGYLENWPERFFEPKLS